MIIYAKNGYKSVFFKSSDRLSIAPMQIKDNTYSRTVVSFVLKDK